MQINLPSDCGNAPRITIVSDFIVAWAAGDAATMATWLADDSTWSLIGEAPDHAAVAGAHAPPPFPPERIDITSVITHGRLASCDGSLEAGSRRVGFSHVFRFTGATKTARIAEVRSYLIDTGSDNSPG